MPILPVVQNEDNSLTFDEWQTEAHEDGILINSEEYNGMPSAEAREAIIKNLEERGIGRKMVNYRPALIWVDFPSALLGRANSGCILR